RARVPLRRGHDAARRTRPECPDVQGVPALHRQPALPADRPRDALRRSAEPVPMDERDDRPQEGAQLLRDARHRVPDRRSPELGVKEGTGENNMDEEWDQMHRITACKAEEDYKLWLRFEDGLEGSVFLGNLLEIGAFQLWRDVREFEKVSVDPHTATVTWEGGIRLDSDVLYQDLASRTHPIQHAGGGNPPPAVG